MNIFYLDPDPTLAAQYQFDRHVVKMPLESDQLLCTAHHLLGTSLDLDVLYRPTHANHPSAVWVRESQAHYDWLYQHFIALCDEYRLRYGKTHACDRKHRDVLRTYPDNLPDNGFTPPPQCMPPRFHDPDTVTAYRNYYQYGKDAWLHDWKHPRTRPAWFGNS